MVERDDSKRHLFFAVIAISFGFLNFITVGDTFQHGITFFLLGCLGVIISLLGMFSGVLFVFKRNKIATKFFRDFCVIGILYGIFFSLIDSGNKEIFLGFIAVWISLLIILEMNKDLKFSNDVNPIVKKGKYFRLGFWSYLFFLGLFVIFCMVWMVNWEEKLGLYTQPNGAGLSYASLNEENSHFSVSIEGGFIYHVEKRSIFGMDEIQRNRYEVVLKATSRDSRININSDLDSVVLLNILNMNSREDIVHLNGEEIILRRGDSIINFWDEQLKRITDKEISESASFGKFIMMEKGHFLEFKVKGGKEVEIEISPQKKKKPINFYVVSDTHSGYNIFMPVLKDIIFDEPDFIVWNGDIVNNGYSIEYLVASSVIESLPIPVFTTIGNHDIWNGGDLFYNMYFGQTYYYFDYKEIRFIFLDSSKGVIGNIQFEWLKSVLEKSKDKKIIVFSHISPIDTITGVFDNNERANKEMSHTIHLRSESDYILGLMQKHNVSAFISGHSHVRGRTDIENTAYITTGVLGGSILPSEDISYLQVFEREDKLFFEPVFLGNNVLDESSFKAKTQSIRVFIIPFLISKSVRISLSVFLLIALSFFMYFFKGKFIFDKS